MPRCDGHGARASRCATAELIPNQFRDRLLDASASAMAHLVRRHGRLAGDRRGRLSGLFRHGVLERRSAGGVRKRPCLSRSTAGHRRSHSRQSESSRNWRSRFRRTKNRRRCWPSMWRRSAPTWSRSPHSGGSGHGARERMPDQRALMRAFDDRFGLLAHDNIGRR